MKDYCELGLRWLVNQLSLFWPLIYCVSCGMVRLIYDKNPGGFLLGFFLAAIIISIMHLVPDWKSKSRIFLIVILLTYPFLASKMHNSFMIAIDNGLIQKIIGEVYGMSNISETSRTTALSYDLQSSLNSDNAKE